MSVLDAIRDAVSPDTATPSTSSDTPEMRLDRALSLLSNHRRRIVLLLLDRTGSVRKRDLADHVAAIEQQTRPQLLDGQARKRVYVALHQTHLRKLESNGALAVENGRIEATPRTHLLADAIGALDRVLGGAA